MDRKKKTTLASLRPYMKRVYVEFIILQKEKSTRTHDGNYVHEYFVADETASVVFVVFGNDVVNEVSEGKTIYSSLSSSSSCFFDQYMYIFVGKGDIFGVENGYTTIYKNSMKLNLGKHGKLKKIGEFKMAFKEEPKMSDIMWATDHSKRPSK